MNAKKVLSIVEFVTFCQTKLEKIGKNSLCDFFNDLVARSKIFGIRAPGSGSGIRDPKSIDFSVKSIDFQSKSVRLRIRDPGSGIWDQKSNDF